jgi:hypothetical protein
MKRNLAMSQVEIAGGGMFSLSPHPLKFTPPFSRDNQGCGRFGHWLSLVRGVSLPVWFEELGYPVVGVVPVELVLLARVLDVVGVLGSFDFFNWRFRSVNHFVYRTKGVALLPFSFLYTSQMASCLRISGS